MAIFVLFVIYSNATALFLICLQKLIFFLNSIKCLVCICIYSIRALNQDPLLKKAVFNYAEQASAFILQAASELLRSKVPQHARRS